MRLLGLDLSFLQIKGIYFCIIIESHLIPLFNYSDDNDIVPFWYFPVLACFLALKLSSTIWVAQQYVMSVKPPSLKKELLAAGPTLSASPVGLTVTAPRPPPLHAPPPTASVMTGFLAGHMATPACYLPRLSPAGGSPPLHPFNRHEVWAGGLSNLVGKALKVAVVLDASNACVTSGPWFALQSKQSWRSDTRRYDICEICSNGYWSALAIVIVCTDLWKSYFGSPDQYERMHFVDFDSRHGFTKTGYPLKLHLQIPCGFPVWPQIFSVPIYMMCDHHIHKTDLADFSSGKHRNIFYL